MMVNFLKLKYKFYSVYQKIIIMFEVKISEKNRNENYSNSFKLLIFKYKNNF